MFAGTGFPPLARHQQQPSSPESYTPQARIRVGNLNTELHTARGCPRGAVLQRTGHEGCRVAVSGCLIWVWSSVGHATAQGLRLGLWVARAIPAPAQSETCIAKAQGSLKPKGPLNTLNISSTRLKCALEWPSGPLLILCLHVLGDSTSKLGTNLELGKWVQEGLYWAPCNFATATSMTLLYPFCDDSSLIGCGTGRWHAIHQAYTMHTQATSSGSNSPLPFSCKTSAALQPITATVRQDRRIGRK